MKTLLNHHHHHHHHHHNHHHHCQQVNIQKSYTAIAILYMIEIQTGLVVIQHLVCGNGSTHHVSMWSEFLKENGTAQFAVKEQNVNDKSQMCLTTKSQTYDLKCQNSYFNRHCHGSLGLTPGQDKHCFVESNVAS